MRGYISTRTVSQKQYRADRRQCPVSGSSQTPSHPSIRNPPPPCLVPRVPDSVKDNGVVGKGNHSPPCASQGVTGRDWSTPGHTATRPGASRLGYSCGDLEEWGHDYETRCRPAAQKQRNSVFDSAKGRFNPPFRQPTLNTINIPPVHPLQSKLDLLWDADPADVVKSEVGLGKVGGAFSPLAPEDADGCQRLSVLREFVKSCTTFLRLDQGLVPTRPLCLSNLRCGNLRKCFRACYGDLTPVQELSVKTIAKLERKWCGYCEESMDDVIDKWRSDRFADVDIDLEHVKLFSEQFGRNVESGWNTGRYPYVPNGHASLSRQRGEGGNWHVDRFASHCRTLPVLSSGKPRVVTVFSEYNTRVLTPLHLSLYRSISRKGWVLVGDPKVDQINHLNGDGDFISLDYVAATDSFKTEYVRAAIEVLISKATDLSVEEMNCLRVLGNLKLERDGDVASRGQPMGSVMSFPLLCLFNKTVQDLALNDCLQEKIISQYEWSTHRCLVNGDDGLTRDLHERVAVTPLREKGIVRRYPALGLKGRIDSHSSRVGMVVNLEKTMVDPNRAEINSTLFERPPMAEINRLPRGDVKPTGVSNPVRLTNRVKSNLAATKMAPDVNDVLGYAHRSTATVSGFTSIVRRNCWILSKQKDKFLDRLPVPYREACLRDHRILRSLQSSPVKERDSPSGYLKMSPRPAGYDLERCEEVETINAEVRRIRDARGGDGFCPHCSSGATHLKCFTGFSIQPTPRFKTASVFTPGNFHRVLRPRRVCPPDITLTCLAKRFGEKKYEKLRTESNLVTAELQESSLYVPDDVLPEGKRASRVNKMIKMIKGRQAPLFPRVTGCSLPLGYPLGSDCLRVYT